MRTDGGEGVGLWSGGSSNEVRLPAVVEFGFFRRIPESDENGDEPVSPDSLDGLQALVDSAVMDSVSCSIGELVGSAGKTS